MRKSAAGQVLRRMRHSARAKTKGEAGKRGNGETEKREKGKRRPWTSDCGPRTLDSAASRRAHLSRAGGEGGAWCERGRAQNHHRPLRRHQRLDGADGGP